MILNTHPENRKEMVKAICELTGMNAMYLFTPTNHRQSGQHHRLRGRSDAFNHQTHAHRARMAGG